MRPNEIETNRSCESTGHRGNLPTDEYDLHCIAIQSDENESFNYSKTSCGYRLDANACLHSHCSHYRGLPPKKKIPATRKRQDTIQPIPRLCVCGCGETGIISGRGLLKRCYSKAVYHGKVDDYPKVKVYRGRAK